MQIAWDKPEPRQHHSGRRGIHPVGRKLLRVYEMQEQVAQRMANRLHDECSQMLAVIYMALGDIACDSPVAIAGRIDGVVEHLDRVGEQLRSLSHELRPLILDQFGLVPALNLLASGVRKRTGLALVLETGEMPALDRMTETAIYRIVQEALANVLRHAGAGEAEVTLQIWHGNVQCTVSDNGCGFDTAAKGAGSGLGLLGIRERIAAMNGRCSIVSAKGKGTRVQVELPV